MRVGPVGSCSDKIAGLVLDGEGDLVIGADNACAIGTLVERTTRFVMLIHLPADAPPRVLPGPDPGHRLVARPVAPAVDLGKRQGDGHASQNRDGGRHADLGNLFFAAAQVVEDQLPHVVESSRSAVVVLRLRGKEDLGSAFIQAVMRYHDALVADGAHLVLAGVGDRVMHQLDRTGALKALGTFIVFPAEASVGKSAQTAIARAEQLRGPAAWLFP